MPKCSVLSCGLERSRNRTKITLHRLPSSEYKKKMWLEEIGIDNLNLRTKTVYICSLHFHESCFNRTLDVIRLHDDAVPSKILMPSTRSSGVGIFTENNQNVTESAVQLEVQDLVKDVVQPPTSSSVQYTGKKHNQTLSAPELKAHYLPSTSSSVLGNSTGNKLNKTLSADELKAHDLVRSVCMNKDQGGPAPKENKTDYLAPDPVNSETSDLPVHTLEIIKKLREKCLKQSKKIKRLNEKVRRQGKKLANFANIIKDLAEKNLLNTESVTAILEECARPKDFLRFYFNVT